MEPAKIFEELMKSSEIQTRLGISMEEAAAASFMGDSGNPQIEVIKEIIHGVAEQRSPSAVYNAILKRLAK